MKKMILHSMIFTLSLMSALSAVASDNIYDYNYWGHEIIRKYTAQIAASGTLETISSDPNKCLPVYKNAIANGVLDIRYALGYFDDSQGTDVMWDGVNYGISPSLDIGMYNSIRRALTEPCSNSEQADLCGFKVASEGLGISVLEKPVVLAGGASVLARMTLTYASASESFVLNQGELSERQKFLAEQSEKNYFGGIGHADIVIYNGHSRDGGGPDFNPPILDKSLHVNYRGYYQVKRPGIRRVLDLIRNGPNKDSVMTFFSCYSRKHFYTDLLKANPKQRLVLSADTIDYYDSLKASMGYLQGFLRGACGQELADVAKQGEKIKDGFIGYQIK
ncbi:MAG: hypothetical protein A2622_10025 [Bdellovibrionales bacterium RIFCSPHIGHO2_01_FULL_40_29]|nr:MAG: hypothetical protein A2622_10025 [Bdellovibrionales bacterium RIFCSPHIGHO2_01_FULL_40_29]OFZ32416.1 MAG: hypothetical protein A3D17_12635 [Bdellovibrionales bacterium RIFCSPHIGHO2_02_FULL_40_15]